VTPQAYLLPKPSHFPNPSPSHKPIYLPQTHLPPQTDINLNRSIISISSTHIDAMLLIRPLLGKLSNNSQGSRTITLAKKSDKASAFCTSVSAKIYYRLGEFLNHQLVPLPLSYNLQSYRTFWGRFWNLMQFHFALCSF